MMTPEQLDEARAREASRLGAQSGWTDMEVVQHAAFLGRTGWTPTDPDLIEAREIVCATADGLGGMGRASVIDGGQDNGPAVRIALAAIKRGRELERGEPA